MRMKKKLPYENPKFDRIKLLPGDVISTSPEDGGGDDDDQDIGEWDTDL